MCPRRQLKISVPSFMMLLQLFVHFDLHYRRYYGDVLLHVHDARMTFMTIQIFISVIFVLITHERSILLMLLL